MAKKRRSFGRKASVRAYRRRFVVATEGQETEPRYFSMFNSKSATITVVLLGSKRKTSPRRVLERLERADIGKNDPAWIVIDRDTWEEEELHQVFNRCAEKGFCMAMSNPMFEYWLLLHFEEGKGVNAGNVTSRLRVHLPDFTKSHVEVNKIRPGIAKAIERAERKDRPPCKKWPKATGSTVYRLVKELRKAASE